VINRILLILCGSCANLFGRYTQIDFWRRCTFVNWQDWNIRYTKTGIARRRTKQAARLVGLTLVLVAVYRARLQGKSLTDIQMLIRSVLVNALLHFRQILLQVWAYGKGAVASVY